MSDSDQDDMEDRRRSYIDSQTGEFLFLEWSTRHDGWVPDVTTIRNWQEGRIRIYRPVDNESTMITYPGRIEWPVITEAEEADIRAVLEHPWIPDGQAYETLATSQIAEADELHQMLVSATELQEYQIQQTLQTSALDAALVPMLLMNIPLRFVSVVPRQDEVLAAVAASLSSAAARPPRQPQTRPAPFPKHLVAAVLAKAEADEHLCPITMEPIKQTDAAITSCGHIFQKAAIASWLEGHDTCPECRQPCS